MELPIFPLNGAVLFPDANLPLNIFEKRYLEMVDYALARDRCIGMIQTDTNNQLYNIGCVGKINNFNETDDGRYLISLQGTACFKVIKELDKVYNFRMVDAKVIDNNSSGNVLFSAKQKKELLNIYRKYVTSKDINLNIEELETIELPQIIKFIPMISPFKNEDKQVLLETKNQVEFYKKLISILELEIIGGFSNRTIN
tara:strand:+ start:1157 stop:1753 length:597 start_codon:yes stop_codon:yes gene_type:complete